MYGSTFGSTLQKLREQKGYSQYQLGELVGVTNKAVSKWETDSAKPKTTLLMRLAEVLEVPLEYLLSGMPDTDDTVSSDERIRKNEIWEQVYLNMQEKYRTYFSYRIENRLQSEKRWAMAGDMLRKLKNLAEFVRLSAEQGEYVREDSVLCSFFTAYSMGVTDINPMPPHYLCPVCGYFEFTEAECAWDLPEKLCRCGQKYLRLGHKIPHDLRWEQTARYIKFRVRPQYMEGAEEVLKTAFEDYTVYPVEQNREYQRTYLLIPAEDNIELSGLLTSERIKNGLAMYTQVSLTAYNPRQVCRKLEQMTNTSIHRIEYTSEAVLQACMLKPGAEVLQFYKQRMEIVAKDFPPENIADCIKLTGLLHTSREWHEKCMYLHDKYGMSLKDIPVYQEDIFGYIRSRLFAAGETDSGLAVTLTEHIKRGRYRGKELERHEKGNLRTFGIEPWFIDILPHIPYLFPQYTGLADMREIMWVIWYYQNTPDAFREIEHHLIP